MNEKTSFTPTEIRRMGSEGIAICWQDGLRSSLSSLTLRQHCPSAISQAKRGDTSHEKPLHGKRKSGLLKVVESSKEEELQLLKVWPVGNYAIGLEWADGHNTGIYTFQLLRELSEQFGEALSTNALINQ